MSDNLPNPILPIAYPKKSAMGGTGDWAVTQPEIDYHQCNGCGICVMICPEGAITLDTDDTLRKPIIDFTVCKGCYLCRHECGRNAMDKDRGST